MSGPKAPPATRPGDGARVLANAARASAARSERSGELSRSLLMRALGAGLQELADGLDGLGREPERVEIVVVPK